MGPGIEITRGLVNHWINFIQNDDFDSSSEIQISSPGFPSDSIVLEEREIIKLVEIPNVKGLKLTARVD
jgi:hypothetical protein